jgi:endonuclease/exonuclease/phosphatase family metal-dependent hydrolase
LLLGAGLSGINPAALGSAPPPAPAGALRIVSFNTTVWNLRDPVAPSGSTQPDEFFHTLKALHADVYLLQEYKPYDEQTGRSVDPGQLAREFPGYHIVIRGELVTLSRLPIAATRALPVDPPAGSDWQTDSWEVKTLRTDLRVGERTISVYNAHMLVLLDAISPFTAQFWRTRRDWQGRRARQFAALENDVRGNSQPMVVAGDFNTTAAMGDLRGLAGQLHDAAKASRSLYPTSWSTDWLEAWRVDWAFTSDEVLVHRYDLVDHSTLSDHRLQDFTVSLKDSR